MNGLREASARRPCWRSSVGKGAGTPFAIVDVVDAVGAVRGLEIVAMRGVRWPVLSTAGDRKVSRIILYSGLLVEIARYSLRVPESEF